MIKKSYIYLLTIFFLLSCSEDSDIKLICDCENIETDYYEGLDILESNLSETSTNNKIYSNPTKSNKQKCWGNRIKDVPITLNDDKNSFLYSNFNEDKINIFNAEEINVLLTQWEGNRTFLHLDRRNLVLTQDTMGITGEHFDVYPAVYQEIRKFQCRIDMELWQN